MIIAKTISEDYSYTEEDVFNIIDDEEVNMTRKLNIDHFFKLIEAIKKKQNDDNEEDTKLAYVAMGGKDDKGGFVDANKLIEVIKKDFEMTIDIEKLI